MWAATCVTASSYLTKPNQLETRMSFFGSKAAERIAGKLVLITGASSGIGKQIAYDLAELAQGDIKLILCARRKERLESSIKELEQKYPKIKLLAVPLDVSKHMEVASSVEKALPAEWKQVDILINNAGQIFGTNQVGSMPDDEVAICFNTNVLGLIALTQYFVPIFKKRNSGDIVNIGSIAGREPYPGGAIYCATKAAVRSFTDALRKETISTKIRVIEVDPGAVETEFSLVRMKGDQSKADAVYEGYTPLYAEDISEIILFAITRKENTVIADTLVFPNNQAGPFHVYKQPRP